MRKPPSRYGKIQDLKLYAKAFHFLQSRNITTLVQLQEIVAGMKKQYWTTNGQSKQTEKLLHERKELIDQAQEARGILEKQPSCIDFVSECRALSQRTFRGRKGTEAESMESRDYDLTQKKSRLYSSLQT